MECASKQVPDFWDLSGEWDSRSLRQSFGPSPSRKPVIWKGNSATDTLKTGLSYGRISSDHVWPDRGDHRGLDDWLREKPGLRFRPSACEQEIDAALRQAPTPGQRQPKIRENFSRDVVREDPRTQSYFENDHKYGHTLRGR